MQGVSALGMLDLGCGTGLAAEAFKDMTARRVGVDLSSKMLEKSQAKQLYDDLHLSDVVAFMRECKERFDLVVATDVLIYVGDPEPLLKAARGVLAPSGLLAFSIESETAGAPYRLNVTGRYSHDIAHILALAKAEGYEPIVQQESVIRTEAMQPVKGMLLVFKKMKTH